MDIKLIVDGECQTPKFQPYQKVYYVYKKRKTINIIETYIHHVVLSHEINYILRFNNLWVTDNTNKLFIDLDEAYKKAETLEIRKNIKFSQDR